MAEVLATDAEGGVLRLPNAGRVIAFPMEEAGGGLYRFNGSNGLWDLQARQDGGGPDQGEVWNWDFLFPYVCIRVNATTPGVRVVAQGIGVDYQGTAEDWADANGFAILGVPASTSVRISLQPSSLPISQIITSPAGPLVPAQSNITTRAQRQAACPASIPVVATLVPDRRWLDHRLVDAIYPRSFGTAAAR
jgi:hypothetical protein